MEAVVNDGLFAFSAAKNRKPSFQFAFLIKITLI
jgi:hypothetical protein